MGGGPDRWGDAMLALGLIKAKNAIAAIWGTSISVRAEDQNAHEPLQRSELSNIFAVKFKQPSGIELTKREQFECDTMFTLRGILHD